MYDYGPVPHEAPVRSLPFVTLEQRLWWFELTLLDFRVGASILSKKHDMRILDWEGSITL